MQMIPQHQPFMGIATMPFAPGNAGGQTIMFSQPPSTTQYFPASNPFAIVQQQPQQVPAYFSSNMGMVPQPTPLMAAHPTPSQFVYLQAPSHPMPMTMPMQSISMGANGAPVYFSPSPMMTPQIVATQQQSPPFNFFPAPQPFVQPIPPQYHDGKYSGAPLHPQSIVGGNFSGTPPRLATDATAPPMLPASPPLAIPTEMPCEHNNWDNLRAKNSIVTLCCRDCQKKWKQHFPIRNLCPEFHARLSCAFGVNCPYLHVHRFKSLEKSPNPLGHVIGSTRDAVFAAAALQILEKHPGAMPRDVLPEVLQQLASHDGVQNAAFSQAPRETDAKALSVLLETMTINDNISVENSAAFAASVRSLSQSQSESTSDDDAVVGLSSTGRISQ